MYTIVGRVSLRPILWLFRCAALPFLLCAVPFGCREDNQSVAPPGQPTVRFTFGRGDHALYNNWNLDEDGYSIISSRFRDSWTVIDTAGQFFGRSPVTVVLDSVFVGTSTRPDSVASVDSLFYYKSPEGDVYQRGFLSTLLKRREGIELMPQWDLIAAFSQGVPSSWVVGYADRAVPVYASIGGSREFVTADVNGMQTVLLSYRIEIGGPDFDAAFWLIDSPPAVFRLRDESSGAVSGMMKELTTLRAKTQ